MLFSVLMCNVRCPLHQDTKYPAISMRQKQFKSRYPLHCSNGREKLHCNASCFLKPLSYIQMALIINKVKSTSPEQWEVLFPSSSLNIRTFL